MWQRNSGRIAPCDGEEEAAEKFPQFLSPALLQALDDSYDLHADDVEELLRDPIAKYPKSLILAAAASGRCRRAMATNHILFSLADIMSHHPLQLALPYFKQVSEEDSDAILVAFNKLLMSADPEKIMQTFKICQALDALPLAMGTLPCCICFWLHAISVDQGLVDPDYFYDFLTESLAGEDAELQLRTVRDYLEMQVMGTPSMQWTEATRTALFDALPKLPALLSSVERLTALFSLAHGAPTIPALPLLNNLPPLDKETFAAAFCEDVYRKVDQDLWKWRDNAGQMKQYLVFQYNQSSNGFPLDAQKKILDSDDDKWKVANLSEQQRTIIDGFLAAIDRADEARNAGYTKQEIWALHHIEIT